MVPMPHLLPVFFLTAVTCILAWILLTSILPKAMLREFSTASPVPPAPAANSTCRTSRYRCNARLTLMHRMHSSVRVASRRLFTFAIRVSSMLRAGVLFAAPFSLCRKNKDATHRQDEGADHIGLLQVSLRGVPDALSYGGATMPLDGGTNQPTLLAYPLWNRDAEIRTRRSRRAGGMSSSAR